MTEVSETMMANGERDLSKVLRFRAMLEALRTEIRDLDADEATLHRLARVHNEIESQLATALPELGAELVEFSSCCHDNPNPSKAEICIAQAQVIGWIEGLFQGVQFTMATARPEPPEPARPESQSAGGYKPSSYL